MKFISPGDPAMKSSSIWEKFNVNPLENASCVCYILCFQLTRNVRFNWNMYNFTFNYLSRGQLVSLDLDKIFLPLLKIWLCYEAFFGNLIFAIIARMLCGNHLNQIDASYWLILKNRRKKNNKQVTSTTFFSWRVPHSSMRQWKVSL